MPQPFAIYTVGGAVRDALLGLPVKDRDYVVVGADPEQLQALGYQSVGKDFPVFLHPDTHEEYALARTERKTAPGYAGFAFHAAADVTLEQDLMRRDLTINAIAMDEQGNLIDPYGGQADIQNKIFRHVSKAYAEDPVRILRLARFAARFPDFSIASETMQLMQTMVQAGEVDALVPERVWQELSRGLMEKKPSRLFQVLQECGALQKILPELAALNTVQYTSSSQLEKNLYSIALQVVDEAAQHNASLAIRFALLLCDAEMLNGHSDVASTTTKLSSLNTTFVEAACARLKIQNEVRDVVIMFARESSNLRHANTFSAEMLVKLFERCDAFRRPERFGELLIAMQYQNLVQT
ncbi:MAG: multifunctional CCA addition/repair protein, partial [Burkholderiales bacterium]|nr:multifunctional CCA addition/repair protein [Burkholderiales bacterium]